MTYKTEVRSKGNRPNFIYHCLPELDISYFGYSRHWREEWQKFVVRATALILFITVYPNLILAILGIAGIGVRNGIDSVVGELWFASDQTSALFIEHFYQSLLVANPSESLRNAQLELIKSPLWNHPRYWSNYILLK